MSIFEICDHAINAAETKATQYFLESGFSWDDMNISVMTRYPGLDHSNDFVEFNCVYTPVNQEASERLDFTGPIYSAWLIDQYLQKAGINHEVTGKAISYDPGDACWDCMVEYADYTLAIPLNEGHALNFEDDNGDENFRSLLLTTANSLSSKRSLPALTQHGELVQVTYRRTARVHHRESKQFLHGGLIFQFKNVKPNDAQ